MDNNLLSKKRLSDDHPHGLPSLIADKSQRNSVKLKTGKFRRKRDITNYSKSWKIANTSCDLKSIINLNLFALKTVAHFCCGDGEITRFIHKEAAASLVEAFDLDLNLLRKAIKEKKKEERLQTAIEFITEEYPVTNFIYETAQKRKQMNNLRFNLTDLALPIEDSPSFDVVFINRGIKRVMLEKGDSGLVTFMENAMKLVKNDGCLIVSVTDREGYKKSMKRSKKYKENFRKSKLIGDEVVTYIVSKGYEKLDEITYGKNKKLLIFRHN